MYVNYGGNYRWYETVAADMNKYILLKGVTVSAATFPSNKNMNATIGEETFIGTSAEWKDQDVTKRWDSTKYYVLVETDIRAKGSQDYDTMIKDDPRVVWWLPIGPEANPDKAAPPVFTLKNINGFADVTVDKTVIESTGEVPSSIEGTGDDARIQSLLKGDRQVAYTIAPEVSGKNQMLMSFIKMSIDGFGLDTPTLLNLISK